MYSESRIIVTNPRCGFGSIKFRNEVSYFDIIAQSLKSMRETLRNIELGATFAAKFKALPAPARSGTAPQIDDDIENSAFGTSDQFRFGIWRGLEMHAAKRPRFLRF